MPKNDEWLHEAEGYEPPSQIRITSIPHGDEPASERCAEATLAAMRTPSKTARKGFESAARWFALSAIRG